jgi:DNA-directed RNA polymerase subunit RPC12/RpoP
MYYRCTNCNGANESKKGYPKKCEQCGSKKLDRAERIRIIVTGEYYRSGLGNNTWMLNDDRTKFITR